MELTATILVNGFVDKSLAVVLFDNIGSHYHYIGRPKPSSILTYCSKPLFSTCNQYKNRPSLRIFICNLLRSVSET